MTNKNWFVTSKKLLKSYSSLNIKFLHLYNFIDLTPSIIEIHNIIDYAYNIQTMIQQFYKNFQRKFVSIQVFKKLQNELNQKTQKITQLMKTQKHLKIQLKVIEDKLNEAQNKLKEIEYKKQFTLPQKIRKNLMERQKQTSIQENSRLDRSSIEMKKKKMSLPQLPSSSTNLGNRQKLINVTKKKKSLFVNIPGQGNEALIQHLMNKISIK